HFDGERYELHSAVVMPNHAHVLFSPKADHRVQDILHSWKSFSANEINKTSGRTGAFWQVDYYDRLVRSSEHFVRIADYIRENPLKAKLREGEFAFFERVGEKGWKPLLPSPNPGIAINSGFLDGLPTADAKAKMIA